MTGQAPPRWESPCAGAAHDASAEKPGEAKIRRRFASIDRTVVVLSGKGGVGKSTVAVNLAIALVRQGMRVGLFDADIHGPSVPKLLALEGAQITGHDGSILPAPFAEGCVVMSIGFFLPSGDQAVIWRGPLKYSYIAQLLGETEWGALDYLIVDLPPGTGDEPLAVAQLIPKVDGALVVTTPQDVALADVRRSIGFCRQLDVPVIGVIENMRMLICPHCGASIEVFPGAGGEALARQTGVRFLGSIPLDPAIAVAGDSGKPFVLTFADSPAAEAFTSVVEAVLGDAGEGED